MHWFSLAGRLVLAAVFAAAAVTKIGDPPTMVRAVRAYQLVPEPAVRPLAYALPYVELGVAVLLLLGLGVRYAAAVTGLLLVVFLVGVASAWARGLRIDCGCFGGGGATPPGCSGSSASSPHPAVSPATSRSPRRDRFTRAVSWATCWCTRSAPSWTTPT